MFNYDEYGLITTSDKNKQKSLFRTCLYYTLAFMNKKIMTEEVQKKHKIPTIRKQLDNETFSQYNEYLIEHNDRLTGYLNALEDHLNNNSIIPLSDLDVYFNDKLQLYKSPRGFLEHPLLDLANKEQLETLSAASQLYGLENYGQKLSHLKLFIKCLTFLAFYGNIDKDEELLVQFILSKTTGDSWWSRTARKLYFRFRRINSGYPYNGNCNVMAAIEYKYRHSNFGGMESTGFKQLWEPVIRWLKE